MTLFGMSFRPARASNSNPDASWNWGTPEGAILGVAARLNADLIVLGVRSAHGHAVAITHFTRSIAYRVVTQATCPVLTVRG